MIDLPDQLSPRESVLMDNQREENRLAREHDIRVKKLELAVAEQQLKWQQVWHLPVLILRLPLLPFMGLAYIVAVWRHGKAEDKFWDWLS